MRHPLSCSCGRVLWTTATVCAFCGGTFFKVGPDRPDIQFDKNQPTLTRQESASTSSDVTVRPGTGALVLEGFAPEVRVSS